MRIVHVIDSGGLYGAERVLLYLMLEQTKLGDQPVLASIGTPHEGEKAVEAEARALGLAVEAFRMRPGFDPGGIRRVLAWARKQDAQLMHSHGYKGDILFGLLPRALRGMPMVATAHGYTGSHGVDRMAVYERLDVLALQRMDRVILVDPWMREHRLLIGKRNFDVVENGIGIPMERVPLPSDLAAFASTGRCIVCAGRLAPEKGFTHLIKALAQLRKDGHDLRLAILGSGPTRSALEAQTRKLELKDHVFFAGYVPDAGRMVAHFDLFVMPSLGEGLPMLLLEAMATGARLIATRVGGMARVLDEGRCGVLINPADVAALCTAINEALSNPAAVTERARAALTRVEEHFSSAAMTRAYHVIYDEVLGAGAAR